MLHFFGGDLAIGAGAAASVASPTPGSRWWLGRTGDTVVALAKAPTSSLDESLAHLAQDVVFARLVPAEHARRAREWAQVAALKPFSMDMGVERVLFGRTHPYGSTGLRGFFLSVEAAQGLHDRLFQPAHATLLVVGDVAASTVEASARQWFGSWVSNSPLPRNAEAPAPDDAPPLSVANARGGAQLRVAVFARGPRPESKDTVALQVVAQLLRGDLSGRLFRSLRESGDAYSTNAGLERRRNATWLAIEGSFATARALDGVRRILEAIASLRDGHVDPDDLALARETLLAGWRVAMSTVDGAAAEYADSLTTGYDRVHGFPARVAGVDVAEVARVTKAYLSGDLIRVLLMGDVSSLNTDSLDIGPAASIDLTK
jgi:hypothetical protein